MSDPSDLSPTPKMPSFEPVTKNKTVLDLSKSLLEATGAYWNNPPHLDLTVTCAIVYLTTGAMLRETILDRRTTVTLQQTGQGTHTIACHCVAC